MLPKDKIFKLYGICFESIIKKKKKEQKIQVSNSGKGRPITVDSFC